MKNLFFGFSFLSYFAFSQTYSLNKVTATNPNEINFVKHTFYEIGFNTTYKLPAWTFYSLTKEHLALANLDRKGSFVKDPLLNAEQAKSADYSGSGFDKGHLVPCEDMSFSGKAMHETFYYSNCVPQTIELNRGLWKVLEDLSRHWGKEYGEVIIISGPVFEINQKKLGEGEIPIPNSFYKIILRHESQTYKALSFILPNTTAPIHEVKNYVCSVDSIEKITSLNFFSELPDHLEVQFESVYNLSDWDFDHHHIHHVSSGGIGNDRTTKSIATQCKALTKKGKRCANKTTSPTSYCGTHQKK